MMSRGSFVLLFMLGGCAAMQGRMAWPETGEVTIGHNHRGGIEGQDSIRQIWVRNGTHKPVRVNVDCPVSEWSDFEVPALSAQGFEEWDGECTATVVGGR